MGFTNQEEKRIKLYFRISVLLKGLLSAAEIVVGTLIIFVPISFFANLVLKYAQDELIENPGDFIAIHLAQLANQFFVASSVFIAVYLLSRGLIKLVLVVALLKNQLWAYPSSLAVLGAFMIYQVYQIAMTFSPLIIALTLFDFIVMWSIWKEYQVVQARYN